MTIHSYRLFGAVVVRLALELNVIGSIPRFRNPFALFYKAESSQNADGRSPDTFRRDFIDSLAPRRGIQKLRKHYLLLNINCIC